MIKDRRYRIFCVIVARAENSFWFGYNIKIVFLLFKCLYVTYVLYRKNFRGRCDLYESHLPLFGTIYFGQSLLKLLSFRFYIFSVVDFQYDNKNKADNRKRTGECEKNVVTGYSWVIIQNGTTSGVSEYFRCIADYGNNSGSSTCKFF